MSAPDTNLTTEQKRHIGPLLGIGGVVAFVGLCLLAYVTIITQPAGEGEADVTPAASVATQDQ